MDISFPASFGLLGHIAGTRNIHSLLLLNEYNFKNGKQADLYRQKTTRLSTFGILVDKKLL